MRLLMDSPTFSGAHPGLLESTPLSPRPLCNGVLYAFSHFLSLFQLSSSASSSSSCFFLLSLLFLFSLLFLLKLMYKWHALIPCGSAAKEPTCNAGGLGSIPGVGRSLGEGKGYSLQYSGLENSMDYAVHGIAKSWTQLSDFHFHFINVLQ